MNGKRLLFVALSVRNSHLTPEDAREINAGIGWDDEGGVFRLTAEELEEAITLAPRHLQDEDCSEHIDPETFCCAVCGVDHGSECWRCGGHGFHKPGCQEADE